MIERWPTKSELKQWSAYRADVDRIGRSLLRCALLSQQAAQVIAACQRWRVDVSDLEIGGLNTRAGEIRADWSKLQNVLARVDAFEIGVRFANNEIDLVAPSSVPRDRVEALRAGLSGWFIPVMLGAVIVAGVLSIAALWKSSLSDIEDQYKQVIKKADSRICADPKSAGCSAWQEEKKGVEYTSRQGLLDSLGQAAVEVGTGIKSGLGVGLALAVPLVVWMVLKK